LSQLSSGDVNLPDEATELMSVGSGWYTFKWQGHKFIAMTEESKNLSTKRNIVCMERAD
jgi:hypothetical protein